MTEEVRLSGKELKRRLRHVEGTLRRAKTAIGAVPEPYYSTLLDRIEALLALVAFHRRSLLAAMIAEEKEGLTSPEAIRQDGGAVKDEP